MDKYSRYSTLEKEFNNYWNDALNTTERNYFSQMALLDFVELKNAISNINNIVTLIVTDKFIDYLAQCQIITQSEAKKIHADIDQTHANTNGFDVEAKDVKIVAEVKCNNPAGNNAFGAAQERSITEDIIHLQKGKTKSKIKGQELRDYYKFMVLLDYKDARPCMQKLIEKLNKKAIQGDLIVKEYIPYERLQKDIVYIAYIKAD